MADLVTKLLLYTNNFDTNIEKSARKMSNLQNVGSRVSGAFGKLGGVVTKLAGTFGLAMGAGEALKVMFTHNDKLADEYGRAMEQAKVATQGFLTSLASGNVMGFIDNLGQITQNARECYDAMDNLNTFKTATNFEMSHMNAEYQVQLNLAKDRTLSEKERLTYLEKAREIMARQTRIQITQLKLTKAAYEAQWRETMDSYGGFGDKATQDKMRRAVENWSQTGDSITNFVNQYDTAMKGYEATIASYKAKVSSGHNISPQEAAAFNNAVTQSARLEQKHGESYRQYRAVLDMVNNPDDGVMKALELRQSMDAITTAISGAELELNRTQARITGTGAHGTHGSGSEKKTYAPGSEGWYDEQISELRRKAKESTNVDEIARFNSEISRLMQQKDALNLSVNLTGWDKVKETLSAAGVALPGTSLQQAQTSTLNIGFDFDEVKKKINEDFKGLKMGKVKIDLGQPLDKMGQVVDAINATAMALDALNMDFDKSAAGVLKWASNVLTASAQAVKAIIAVTAAKSAQSAAEIPVVGWLLAAGAAASVLASLTALCAFADGGIVKGNRFAGDTTLVRANAGEMILNKGQQANLFRLLDGEAGSGSPSGKVVFEIQGDRLRGVLDNHDKKARKYS